MSEQLQTALAEMLGKANAGIDAGASFLQAQLPDVIQQLLMWKAVASGLSCLLSVALFIAIIYGYCRLVRWDMATQKYDKGFASFMAGGAVLIGLIIASFLFSIAWLQILIAPKIYLIEYAASLAE